MINDRHLLVTGAGGFIGSRLARALLSDPAHRRDRFTFVDLVMPDLGDPRARRIVGDVGDPSILGDALGERADVVFHLAGILGGAAEADPRLARRINIDATLDLLERVKNESAPTRVVFASSIAVYGPPLPSHVNDDSVPVPTMIYGAQKRMIETAVEQATARGWIDGVALRFPGVVARPGADEKLKSAYLNAIFFAFAEGRDITIPVTPTGASWLLSVSACVQACVEAGRIPLTQLGRRRALTLPCLRVTMGQLITALRARFPDSPTRVDFDPDPELVAQFASYPSLETELGERLGLKHDGDVATLVTRALLETVAENLWAGIR